MNRNLWQAAQSKYDLIVIGGGAYGVALTLEASRRGLSTLLLERHDFGQETTANSLRIIHGGLRYLQSLDLSRHYVSVRERRRFLRDFPDLVRPLACLMPLYNEGLKRRSVMRLALSMNDALSVRRNVGVSAGACLPAGRIVGPDETIRLLPAVDRNGLRGGALWYDAMMRNWQRVVCEMLRWARHLGATTLNYVEAVELLCDQDRVRGIAAKDSETGESIEFRTAVVANCAGPWCGQLARRLDREGEIGDSHYPSLAFNIQLDCPPPSEVAVAATPRRRHARTYFVLPWRNSTIAGTYHAPYSKVTRQPRPLDADVDAFLTDLNAAIPELSVTRDNILRIYSGLLPVNSQSSVTLAKRETIIDHGRRGGPQGLFSVVGVKLTTARHVACRVLRHSDRFWNRKLSLQRHSERPSASTLFDFDDPRELIDGESTDLQRRLRQLMSEESVLHLDDILFRRTDWGCFPSDCVKVANRIAFLLEWDQQRCEMERSRINAILQSQGNLSSSSECMTS